MPQFQEKSLKQYIARGGNERKRIVEVDKCKVQVGER